MTSETRKEIPFRKKTRDGSAGSEASSGCVSASRIPAITGPRAMPELQPMPKRLFAQEI